MNFRSALSTKSFKRLNSGYFICVIVPTFRSWHGYVLMSVLQDHGVVYVYFYEIPLLVPTVICGTCSCYFVVFAASENIKIIWPSRKQIITKDNVTPNPIRKLNFYLTP